MAFAGGYIGMANLQWEHPRDVRFNCIPFRLFGSNLSGVGVAMLVGWVSYTFFLLDNEREYHRIAQLQHFCHCTTLFPTAAGMFLKSEIARRSGNFFEKILFLPTVLVYHGLYFFGPYAGAIGAKN